MVDDRDFNILSKYKWYAKNKKSKPLLWYAARSYRSLGVSKTKLMHREILKPSKNDFVDHINGNGLDNRRLNLRICNNSKNLWNSRVRKDNKTGFRGVHFCVQQNRFRAQINVDKKPIYLGSFKTAKKAALAYLRAHKKFYKKFGYYNRGNNK